MAVTSTGAAAGWLAGEDAPAGAAAGVLAGADEPEQVPTPEPPKRD